MVVKFNYDSTHIDLFNLCKKIEDKLGRVKEVKWGPREIDLDILLFNDNKVIDHDLIIPHKEIKNRDFVLEPLLELEEDLVDPVSNDFYKSFITERLEKHIIRKFPFID